MRINYVLLYNVRIIKVRNMMKYESNICISKLTNVWKIKFNFIIIEIRNFWRFVRKEIEETSKKKNAFRSNTKDDFSSSTKNAQSRSHLCSSDG